MGGPADDKPRAPRAGTPLPPRAPTPTAHEPGVKPPARANSVRPGGAKALIGLTISDRYKIERLLGEGGMGAVYQAEHTLMRKRMAIKVLHPEMTRLPEVVQRFEREAMAAAHIDHPHVVTATDFGKLDDGSFFLALEFVEGKSLREAIAEGRLELGRALHIARQMAAALSRAHGLNIVHRDLKPENVMLVERDGDPDFVKVLDFGIAKVPIGELGTNDKDAAGPGQPVLTQAGMVYGTPEYMAPEQALGQPVDARADLYALGIILYEMLCGVRPFEAESKVALLGMQVTAPMPPTAQKCPEANVPPEVEALILRLLAKEATERVGEAKEVIEGITTILIQLAAMGRIDARYAPPPTSGPMHTNPGLISGISPAPADLKGPSVHPPALSRQSEPPKVEGLLSGRGWIIAMAAGLIGLVLMVTTIVYVLKGRNDPDALKDGGVTTTATDGGATPTTDTASLDDKVKEGIALIQRGDYGSGIEKLESLGDQVASREDVHRALFSAYNAKKATKETLREARAILEANPTLVQGPKDEVEIRVAIRDATLLEGTKDAALKPLVDDAFSLQENNLGFIGWDDIFDTAYGVSAASYKDAASRAQKILAKGDRAKMSPALQVLLDLHGAGASCGAKAHFDRAVDKGDERALNHLKKLSSQHNFVGTGRRRRDELGCLHDGQLARAIAALEDRLAKEKKKK
ncbi:MAG: serine/threonine protein kinase [Deltaproteobacteria bacterium]|nr:serine/threonine protein kinase [Deltaproteobacteria bacterium]